MVGVLGAGVSVELPVLAMIPVNASGATRYGMPVDTRVIGVPLFGPFTETHHDDTVPGPTPIEERNAARAAV